MAQFMVYMLAMTGLLVIGCVVYKKTVAIPELKKHSALKIIDMLKLPDKKILYFIKCKDEEFLIASSTDKITLISKIETERNLKRKMNEESIEKYLREKEEKVQDLQGDNLVSYAKEDTNSKKHFIKSLLKELSDKNQSKRGNY